MGSGNPEWCVCSNDISFKGFNGAPEAKGIWTPELGC